MLWHNNFDSIYNRPPKPLGDALLQYIADSCSSDPGSRVIEDLRSELNATGEVIKAIATVLTPAQQATVAQLLRLKPGSNAE